MSNLNISRAERLDMRVIAMHPDLTRSAASNMIADGKVTVNDEVQTKSGFKLRPGDNIVVDYNIDEMQAIPSIELKIIYEDDDCVVIEKPIGVLSHSKGAFNPEGTVASWLGEHLVRLGKESAFDLDAEVETGGRHNPRAGIVHRLDRATSGVMICAKTPDALAWMQKQFSQRKTKKTYMAITEGHLKPAEAIIDMPIERHPKQPQTFRVGINGKSALTGYKVLEAAHTCELVELSPTTGRTHQLRVHMKQVGHGIVGDPLYGDKNPKAERLFLHAHKLELTLPSKERKVFTSPVPDSFKQYLAADNG